MRTLLMWIVVLSFFGMAACDLRAGEWRMGLAGVLLGFVQLLVFWR